MPLALDIVHVVKFLWMSVVIWVAISKPVRYFQNYWDQGYFCHPVGFNGTTSNLHMYSFKIVFSPLIDKTVCFNIENLMNYFFQIELRNYLK